MVKLMNGVRSVGRDKKKEGKVKRKKEKGSERRRRSRGVMSGKGDFKKRQDA